MTTILKPSEAMSHGRIMKIKREEIKTINEQIYALFGKGGEVEKVPEGKSGMKDGAKFKFSI